MGPSVRKTARRIAAELVLMPTELRGETTYSEEYLQRTSGCRVWTKLRCANCVCHKAED